MDNEDYVLLSKDDYINVLNQQEHNEHLDKDGNVELILNSNNNQFEAQKEETYNYLINNDEHNENQQLNDTENSKDQQINESQMFREQDLYLPLTNISRIMKQNLPKEGKIAKEAKITVQECISEFISFIASEASDRCLAEKRKTLNGDDILYAMQTLGFDNYIEPLRIFLQKYKQLNSTSAHLNSNQESDHSLNQQK